MFISISELFNTYLLIELPGHNQTLPGPGPGWARAWLRHCLTPT